MLPGLKEPNAVTVPKNAWPKRGVEMLEELTCTDVACAATPEGGGGSDTAGGGGDTAGGWETAGGGGNTPGCETSGGGEAFG